MEDDGPRKDAEANANANQGEAAEPVQNATAEGTGDAADGVAAAAVGFSLAWHISCMS